MGSLKRCCGVQSTAASSKLRLIEPHWFAVHIGSVCEWVVTRVQCTVAFGIMLDTCLAFLPAFLPACLACEMTDSWVGNAGGIGQGGCQGSGRLDCPLITSAPNFVDSGNLMVAAPPNKLWSDDSPVKTNEQWFPMVSKWCEMDFVHPQYQYRLQLFLVQAFLVGREPLRSRQYPNLLLREPSGVDRSSGSGHGSTRQSKVKFFFALPSSAAHFLSSLPFYLFGVHLSGKKH